MWPSVEVSGEGQGVITALTATLTLEPKKTGVFLLGPCITGLNVVSVYGLVSSYRAFGQ